MLFRVEHFENALFVCACGRTRTELFETLTSLNLLVPLHSRLYFKLLQDGGQALHFLVFNTII